MNKTLQIIMLISRVLMGAVFTYSGFVKAVDPMGSQIKFDEYFIAFGMPGMAIFSMFLSFVLSAAELAIGLSFLFRLRMVFASWSAMLFMLIFTPLTLWLAVTNAVDDCGCFGDAVKLTNWGTFWKNVIIDVFVAFIFIFRKRYTKTFFPPVEWILAFSGFLFSISLSWYSLQHLPPIDFRPYKVGTYLPALFPAPEDVEADEYVVYMKLKELETGKTIEVTSDEYTNNKTYQDKEKYEYLSMGEPVLVKEGEEPEAHDFYIIDPETNEDLTRQFITDQRFIFMVIAYNINEASDVNADKINALSAYCDTVPHCQMIGLTNSLNKDIEAYRERTGAEYVFYNMDEKALEAVIRSSPGLVLIKNGYILGKWHYNDIPTIEELKDIEACLHFDISREN